MPTRSILRPFSWLSPRRAYVKWRSDSFHSLHHSSSLTIGHTEAAVAHAQKETNAAPAIPIVRRVEAFRSRLDTPEVVPAGLGKGRSEDDEDHDSGSV